AALHGIEWCHDNSNSHIILEMDSQIAVNMIKGLTPVPWTLTKTDHNIAEALGAQFATKIVKDKGYEKCTIEMDSKIIVDMMQSSNSQNLNLRPIMEDIICLIDKNDINFIHCFREANKVADYLAKWATTIIYDNFNEVPEGAKGPFFLDKVQMPSFRFKYDKANFFVS
ncbi:hypothetical protein MTR67_008463, partial [Solanum verrucosum]